MILRLPGDAVRLRAARMERDDFRTRCTADPVSFVSDSGRDLLTAASSKSEQESSVRSLPTDLFVGSPIRRFTDQFMQFCMVDCFYASGRTKIATHHPRRLPGNRRQMTRLGWRGCFVLPVATRQADRPYLLDVRFSLYFVFANRRRAGNHGACTQATGIDGEMEIVSSHRTSQAKRSLDQNSRLP